MSFFKRVYNKSWNMRLDIFLWRKRKRLKNHGFSIISNNCVGGVMTHDLHERFNSPTVNLWFKQDDFFEFVCNLDHYLYSDIVECFENGIDYPIGRIFAGDKHITVYFMHYDNFSDAQRKWRERAARVNKDNMFIVFEYPAIQDSPEVQEEVKEKFDAIPFENKVMITRPSKLSNDNIVHMNIYDNAFFPGKLLSRKNRISVKRYLDDYDYVSFLNKRNYERIKRGTCNETDRWY